MIFITTEDLLHRFQISFEVTLKNGRKVLSLKSTDKIEKILILNIEKALNGRLSGDSINYELAISNIVSENSICANNDNIYSLLYYLILESGLVNCTFDIDNKPKKLQEVKKTIASYIVCFR